MFWIGKAVGGVLGFVAAGPLGSLLGVLLGHQFDQGYETPKVEGSAPEQGQQLFFEATFAAMGRVAKVDGRVSEEEIRAARRIMHDMGLSPEQVRAAIDHFTAGKDPGYPLTERLDELARRVGGRHDLLRAFMEIQVRAVLAAGSLGQEKRALLWRIAKRVGIGRVEMAQIEAVLRARQHAGQGRAAGHAPSLEDAYRVLGIESAASDEEVKKAYRRLMNQHHPDKLVARGLPKSMASVAQEKTQQIRAAYERIKAHRALR